MAFVYVERRTRVFHVIIPLLNCLIHHCTYLDSHYMHYQLSTNATISTQTHTALGRNTILILANIGCLSTVPIIIVVAFYSGTTTQASLKPTTITLLPKIKFVIPLMKWFGSCLHVFVLLRLWKMMSSRKEKGSISSVLGETNGMHGWNGKREFWQSIDFSSPSIFLW